MSGTETHYQIQSDAKSTTIQLQPDIGNAAWGDIEEVGTELLTSIHEKKSAAWLIDLSQLEYMGSALVALLVRIWKAVQAGGGKIVVVCGDGMPRDVIKLAGLDKVWTITPNTADAYRTLGLRAPAVAPPETSTAQTELAAGHADEFPMIGVLSLLAAIAAGGVLALTLSRVGIDRNLAQLGMFGASGIAVAFGLLSLFKERSWGRVFGVIALVAGVAVAAFGYTTQPAEGAAAASIDATPDGIDPADNEFNDPPDNGTPGNAADSGDRTATDESESPTDSTAQTPPDEEDTVGDASASRRAELE